MSDLFGKTASSDDYDASNIEVLEGLEPVRHRPGMYVGGTDERALHHLAAEILDNAMDEAVAGHANRIDFVLESATTLTIRDNGRGMPTGQHPKFPDKSAVEVIMTTLHAGGKFSGKSYATSGGLHGVGASVVNALSSALTVEIARDKMLYRQDFSRGMPMTALAEIGAAPNRRGTTVTFTPDTEIFGENAHFRAATLYRMARSKAYLFAGVEIRWRCDPALLGGNDTIPAEANLHFPGGLADALHHATQDKGLMISTPFAEIAELDEQKFEWAITWLDANEDGFFSSYCNTVPTPSGGTHETGFRQAIVRALRAFGELTGNKKAADISADDALANSAVMLSVFLRDPQFQGQTKDRLVSADATRLTEQAVRDRFDHWLLSDTARATYLLDAAIERAEDRKRRKKEKEVARKSATRRLRLPGKLADCTSNDGELTELFLVEGDSAGGSAKQARNRKTQAVLPLRGKILNVASASSEKLTGNQELSDLALALGVKPGKDFKLDDLRYGRVIIMTDADVDGAHIAALLMTYFYREMPHLVEAGRLFLAQPPLYRLTQGGKTEYALDDEQRETLLTEIFDKRGKVEVSRFKGLGEMPPAQLKETTMNPASRRLLRVDLPMRDSIGADLRRHTDQLVNTLMGKKAELRFGYIRDHADDVLASLDL
ncbi:DNA topoisomerase IV subunit B [Alphaproteobacteria bacterium]|nr:DNA topoisomerase IV subunit B [Alphaproteobacteria bacterium]MDC1121503.1 DNA topoisomerase IV subunit B [Alphaproteobacteria bacterium]